MGSDNPKILPVDELAAILDTIRANGRRLVLCHGVFDLLHIGHIRYFEQARRHGDVLVVTVTPDRFVDKGPHRPAFGEELRAEAVASLGCVDFVAVNLWPTAEETLRTLRPHVYVKGAEFKNLASDPTGKIAREAAVVEEIGATIAFAEDIVFSSSNLINRYLSNLPEELSNYVELFRSRHSLPEIVSILDRMSDLRVLVIGDTILDEYQYCEAIGKSSKDPTLVLRYQSHDLFAGGVLAVANHVANFAGAVDLVTLLGERDRHEEFIRGQLHAKVRPFFHTQPGAPTLVKRRFLDGYSFNKLLEVYLMDDSGLPPAADAALNAWLAEHLADYDLVIASDFGHGAISAQAVATLCQHAPYLAINTQANAGNRGFHTVSRYPHADYACIAEHELRLETRAKNGNLLPAMQRIARQLGTRRMVVTTGRKGCTVVEGDQPVVQVPAFAQKIVDRVGAGDAFLSVTAMAAVQEAPSEILGFLGNIVGGLAVEVIGNKKSIDRASVQKYVTAVMK
ncbi:MAG: PfkB family carbohydrate kinase [Thermodesulfobacteriota bacterium]